MEIARNALRELLTWKNKPQRKPLLLRGARQVGKTTLVRQFSAYFDHYIELNLEKKTDRDIFKQSDNINEVLSIICLYKQIAVLPNPTLLFIDEIQESPEAISLLRFFYEEKPEIFVIAAGSLLEFSLRSVPSFPVGRIEYLTLHPVNFQEFLGAVHPSAQELIYKIPVPDYAHPVMIKLFHTFAITGGMPEIVKTYAESGNIASVTPIYRSLWQAYKDDVEKYARNQSERTIMRHIFETAPHESDRIKFEGFGRSNYRSREVGEAFRALDLAMIIRLIYPSTDIMPPATANYRKRPRLQFLDTGLLTSSLLLQGEMIGIPDLNDYYRGRIIQHLVGQELISIHKEPGYKLMFWVKEDKGSDAEVDLIYPYRQWLIPIEIKSGEKGTLRSLHQFINLSGHSFAIRLYAGSFKTDQAVTPAGKPYVLMNLPYYLGTMLPEYIQHLTENFAFRPENI